MADTLCNPVAGLSATALSDLDALAIAASPGPWEYREAHGLAAVLTHDGWLGSGSAKQATANARFIAAANPETVRALVAIAQRAVNIDAAGLRLGQAGLPTRYQAETPVDSRGSHREVDVRVIGTRTERSSVIMPRSFSEKLRVVLASAVRAGLCDMSASAEDVVQSVFKVVYAHLSDADHEAPPHGATDQVWLPAELDGDLLQAGLKAFGKASKRQAGLDLCAAAQIYQGLYDTLAARKRRKINLPPRYCTPRKGDTT